MEYYTLELCGLTRKLPIIRIGKSTSLPNFTFLGDVELVDRIADTFTEKLKDLDFDYLVGPEVKVVPLVHGLAKRLGHKRYVICRKSVRPYMVNPVILKPLPIFPKHVKQLVINGPDREILEGKKVVIIDDVVSTGITMKMMEKLMVDVGAKLVAFVAVLRQGEQFTGTPDHIFLGTLPIFKDNPQI